REKYNGRWLWIDAICINQEDTNGRNCQVQQMGDIYWEATQVLSWLGTNRHTSWFLKTIRENPEVSPNFFLANEYWKRAWITQEIVKARKIIL
ncbi:HET-domain-containing protein, partial [Mytilinidion resinicola]